MKNFTLSFLIALSLFITSNCFCKYNNIKKVGMILYSKAFLPAFKGFKNGLKGLGYVEGKNVIYYVNNIDSNVNKIKEILKKFKDKKVNLIFTTTTCITLSVKSFANQNKIPVVFNEVGAPVLSNVVDSLHKPGSYLTGVSHFAFHLLPKRLEIFKEAFPHLKNILIFYDPYKPIVKNQFSLIKDIVKKYKLKIDYIKISCRRDMKEAISKIVIPYSANAGIFMWPDAVAMANADLIISFSKSKKLPLMVLDNILIPKGGSIGYSPSFYKVGVQSAFIAKKIFSGVFPGNIPVQLPESIELVVNLKEIKRLGLLKYFNKSFLIYANKVIK